MKARVKATGEIIEISEECSYIFAEHYDKQYDLSELEFIQGPMRMEIFPDYWTHLEHQYAGMAMQGLSEKYFNEYRDYCAGFEEMDEDEAKEVMKDFSKAMADVCNYFATALVEKLKEEEKK